MFSDHFEFGSAAWYCREVHWGESFSRAQFDEMKDCSEEFPIILKHGWWIEDGLTEKWSVARKFYKFSKKIVCKMRQKSVVVRVQTEEPVYFSSVGVRCYRSRKLWPLKMSLEVKNCCRESSSAQAQTSQSYCSPHDLRLLTPCDTNCWINTLKFQISHAEDFGCHEVCYGRYLVINIRELSDAEMFW